MTSATNVHASRGLDPSRRLGCPGTSERPQNKEKYILSTARPVSAEAMTTRATLLTVNNLRKYFPVRGGLLNRTVGHIQAVDDVSFSVMKGETLGIVGESGCGKSTLARLLLYLVLPDAGELIFDGAAVQARDGMSLPELRRNVQMVFQDSYSSLNPRMPVTDSIAYGPRVHGAKPAAARWELIAVAQRSFQRFAS